MAVHRTRRLGPRIEAVVLIDAGAVLGLAVGRRRDVAGADIRIPGLGERRRGQHGDESDGREQLFHGHLQNLNSLRRQHLGVCEGVLTRWRCVFVLRCAIKLGFSRLNFVLTSDTRA